MTGSKTRSNAKKPGAGKVAQAAAQAAAAVEPLKNRATELAAAAAAAAGPRTARAKQRAVGVAETAGALGAKSVNAVGDGIDKVTGGKLSKPISALTSAIEDRIHPDNITPTPRATKKQS